MEPWGVQINQTPQNAYPRLLGRRQGLGSAAKGRSHAGTQTQAALHLGFLTCEMVCLELGEQRLKSCTA